MDKLKMHSPDLIEQNIDKIAELFPTVIIESLDGDSNRVTKLPSAARSDVQVSVTRANAFLRDCRARRHYKESRSGR